MTPELNSKIANWRARMDGQGEPISLEEYRQIVAALRGGRASAQAASDASRRKKATIAIPSADDMLDEMA